MTTAARHCALPLAASLGLHGLLALIAAVWLMVSPVGFGTPRLAAHEEPAAEEIAEPPPEEHELDNVDITFIPPEELAKTPPEPAKPDSPGQTPRSQVHVVASEDMPALAPFASDTSFISDRNLRAASASTPVPGADPRIPNQDGVDLPGMSLFNADHTSGSTKPQPRPSPLSPLPTPPAPAPPEPPDQRPPDPAATVQTDNPSAPAPQQEKPATPAMRERPPEPLALTDPTPPTKPKTLPPVVTIPQSTKGHDNGPRPVVSSVKTKIEGSLAVRGGDSSVDAKDTPEGRFLSAMHDRIGLLWNTRLASVRGLAGAGSVEVEFDIDINARVSNVRLVDPGKANPVLEDVCLSAVIKAKLPPLPPSLKREIQDPLSGGKLRRKISFHRL